MHATDIVGWTADADTYCTDCAERRYGPDREGRLDNEGNEIQPIFAIDSDGWRGATCRDCEEPLML